MKKYIFQLIISDNQDTIEYQNGAFPTMYTAVKYCSDNNEAYNEVMNWTYTITEKDSEDYDFFEMLVNGYPLSFLINN